MSNALWPGSDKLQIALFFMSGSQLTRQEDIQLRLIIPPACK
jgi:hypothetical protein